MSVFEQKLSFRIFYFMKNDHKIIVKCWWGARGVSSSATGSWGAVVGVQEVKPLKKFDLFTSGRQISLK